MQKREVHTRGVVVGRRAAGEGSVRVTLYTEELGLVSAVAKSAREERSKLRAHLVEGTRGTYSLVKGKEVWRLTGAVRTQNIFYESPGDGAASASRVLSLMRQFIQGEGADAELFASVWEYLEALPTLQADDIRIAEYIVVLRMLAALGYIARGGVADELLGAEYSAALLVLARERRKELVKVINDGIGASGL
ncbi:MAG: DNA repair protein RecO [Patescibacteria group bacterium]